MAPRAAGSWRRRHLQQAQQVDDLVVAPVADVAPGIVRRRHLPVHPVAGDAVGVEAVHRGGVDELGHQVGQEARDTRPPGPPSSGRCPASCPRSTGGGGRRRRARGWRSGSRGGWGRRGGGRRTAAGTRGTGAPGRGRRCRRPPARSSATGRAAGRSARNVACRAATAWLRTCTKVLQIVAGPPRGSRAKTPPRMALNSTLAKWWPVDSGCPPCCRPSADATMRRRFSRAWSSPATMAASRSSPSRRRRLRAARPR